MNYAGQQAGPVSSAELRALCEELAPDALPAPTVPAATDLQLDPAEILTNLKGAAAALALEDGVLEAVAIAISQGHVILTGPPGTAKSTLAMMVAEVAKGDAWTPATATAEWTVHDVVGGYMPASDRPLIFEPGLVLNAFQAGKWVVIDELNRADIDKAFGELFTILSGFGVTLPQRDQETGQHVTVAPAGGSGQFTVPPGWRMLGTMNTWDKTSLFRLSYAFMRRFAFIEIAVPPQDVYEELIGEFMAAENLVLGEDVTLALYSLFAGNALRDVQRELGPGIAKTVIAHLRSAVAIGLDESAGLLSAIRAHVLPQFEGAFESHDAIVAAFQAWLSDVLSGAETESLMRSLASWTGGGLPGSP